jgi:hypothetical protein
MGDHKAAVRLYASDPCKTGFHYCWTIKNNRPAVRGRHGAQLSDSHSDLQPSSYCAISPPPKKFATQRTFVQAWPNLCFAKGANFKLCITVFLFLSNLFPPSKYPNDTLKLCLLTPLDHLLLYRSRTMLRIPAFRFYIVRKQVHRHRVW